MLGSKDSALKYLNKCIYTVDMGNNDYIMNYFMPQFYSTSRQYNVEQFAAALIQQYSEQLKDEYKNLHSGATRDAPPNIDGG
ncbi:GDSL esterase/lipase [Salix suchowensis]|nr:GDSL esterase/lipase [Salix suchowensis]